MNVQLLDQVERKIDEKAEYLRKSHSITVIANELASEAIQFFYISVIATAANAASQ